ncbi:alpha-glucan phosphorylase [Beutenbergia cavernae DSM 12333]|uniref:glycogen phosphorylase n=1 Tax=Beutenbergia cavernae (strain ATCC BAA-8 / DSM 12333 / CCUG 43141 / JCM 11478 / NBRC 16432 / NCIMB 13614 / HKI 0122) TaxID=471853 RepID=C5C1X9_BEUC1|nr:alpha-glucan family phosphorylase [Beutenbergia cavernae]ACQ79597.1 alpha-glucan phosphorylase [Beutenbergia cavernae DSM 12333]
MRAFRRFTVRTVLPEPLAPLDELARNLRWSWHAPTRELFASIDPQAWAAVRSDPVALLGAVSPERLAALAADPDVVARVHAAADDLRAYLTMPRWYQSLAPEGADGSSGADRGDGPPRAIAYFSAEFGITAVLPQYSGGLGILAGDHLKSASDLGVPIVGVGLLYGAGYFKQSLTRDGWQHETYPVLDPDNLPLTALREDDGTLATIEVPLPGGRTLRAQVWRADVGRVPLLLLDSNVAGNDDAARRVTDRLYGGTSEHRLQQELLLGIGGVRALRLFSRLTGAPEPEVYHANEGHAGFLGVERIREIVELEGTSFAAAREAVRAGTVFTTHTPVPAGIDRFGVDLVRSYLGGASELPGVPVDEVLALGAEDYDGGDPTVFNMAVMGLRLAKRANGVSLLHGAVSREMFSVLWPGFDAAEVPIASVTNGVHGPTWTDPEFAGAAQEQFGADAASGAGWLRGEDAGGVSDGRLWSERGRMRARLVHDARERVRRSWSDRGASPAELGWVDDVLDPDVLTIGFARRVPTYKRLTLMLRDPERLTRLLLDPDRPIQIVVAGKSHPADEQGVGLIQKFVQFADDERVRERIVFLPNYDIAMAQVLMPGCDVWLNNPLRPLEASGTSGMKCALNGALNLSILDGWWDEWFDGQNGWAIPTADGVEDPERRDDLEAAALYELLEGTVVPRFYDRDADGLPRHWLEMVRHTLATLGPKVQATRMVADYVEQLYAPTALDARAMDGTGHAGAVALAAWKERVRAGWPAVRVDHVETEGADQAPRVGDAVTVRAFVSLGDLAPSDVDVQVTYGRVGENDELTSFGTLSLAHTESYEAGRHQFSATVALERPGAFGYGVRVVPRHEGLAGATELGLVVNAA